MLFVVIIDVDLCAVAADRIFILVSGWPRNIILRMITYVIYRLQISVRVGKYGIQVLPSGCQRKQLGRLKHEWIERDVKLNWTDAYQTSSKSKVGFMKGHSPCHQ